MNPQYLNIEENIVLTDFSQSATVKIQFHQDNEGVNYYRIKCMPDPVYSPGLPVFYLYLNSYSTIAKWKYSVLFTVTAVKDENLNDTNFQSLFTQFPDNIVLRPKTILQSSKTANFSTVETSEENRLLDIRLSGDAFAPTWVCPTWVDERYSTLSGVAVLTGSDQKGVQGISRFRFNLSEASGKYGTSIEEYSIIVSGGFSHNLTPSHVATVGTDYLSLTTYFKLVGDVTVTFSATDTRGLTTSFSRVISIVPYAPLYLTYNDTHRKNGTGTTVVLDFAGRWYGDPLTLSCVGIVAREEGSATPYATIVPTGIASGSMFAYRADWTGVTFDSAKSYTIAATFTDNVKTVSVIIPIPVGTPSFSVRDRKVGVNNPSPNYALDVNGVIGQNGYPVIGFVKSIVGETSPNTVDLNDYVDSGFYIYNNLVADPQHFPSANRAFLLEVVGFGSYKVQKLYYVETAETYIRTMGNYWTSWKQVTLT